MQAEVVPERKSCDLKQVSGASVWADQARKIGSWRVGLSSPPSRSRERSVQERLKLLHLLERQCEEQGLEALRTALQLRFGTLEQAFRFLDVADRGEGPSLLEMSGSLALLGLDVSSLCGQGECEVFNLLDVDRDGRIGLKDLLGTSVAPGQSGQARTLRKQATRRESLQDMASEMKSWDNDLDAAQDPTGRVKWALLAKLIALSSWFDTPAQLRFRGRPDVQEAGYVSLSLGLNQLDFPRLLANRALLSAVTLTLKESIAREGGVLPSQVQLKLPAGSSSVQARIELPTMLLAQSFQEKLDTSRTFLERLAATVQNLAGIESVATGLITVSSLRISKAQVTHSSTPQKVQSASPVVGPPGGGAIGLGPPTGTADLHMLKFQKVQGATIPEGWYLATHEEVKACMSDILLLMDDWDICGLAGGWRFDGAGYGHNLKEPCGPADFSMIIVCREDDSIAHQATSEDLAAPRVAPETPAAHVGGALEKQQALDALRQCWSPNEGDLENALQILQVQFLARATARQFGEPLMSRSDIAHLLGKLPPPGLGEALTESGAIVSPLRQGPSNAEVGELYDAVLEMQLLMTSRQGRALSKGLTFESLHVLLQKVACSMGLHFRHIVDDAVETPAESLRKQVSSQYPVGL